MSSPPRRRRRPTDPRRHGVRPCASHGSARGLCEPLEPRVLLSAARATLPTPNVVRHTAQHPPPFAAPAKSAKSAKQAATPPAAAVPSRFRSGGGDRGAGTPVPGPSRGTIRQSDRLLEQLREPEGGGDVDAVPAPRI